VVSSFTAQKYGLTAGTFTGSVMPPAIRCARPRA
jgi:hypothetical protein